MEAPNKIYILHHEDYSDRRILNAFIEKEQDTDIEYIRKEVLLEWTKEKANDYKGTANIRRSFEMMIRKIESL